MSQAVSGTFANGQSVAVGMRSEPLVIPSGATSMFLTLGHGVQTVANSLHMATAEFEALVRGVQARVNQGLMDVVTLTQLRQQMLSARGVG